MGSISLFLFLFVHFLTYLSLPAPHPIPWIDILSAPVSQFHLALRWALLYYLKSSPHP